MLSKGEKGGRPGREKNRVGQKDKSRDCCVTVLAQNYFKILLSVHANFMPQNFRKSYFASGTEGQKVINLKKTVGSLGFL